MKRNADGYLAVLQRHSCPVERWSERWIDEDQHDAKFDGDPVIYRCWDATQYTEFPYRIAEWALEMELQRKAKFAVRYD